MGGGGGDDSESGNRNAGMNTWQRVGAGLLTGGLSEVYVAASNYVEQGERMQKAMRDELDRNRADAEEMEQRMAAEEGERKAQQGLIQERDRQKRRLRSGRSSQGREGTILTQMGESGDAPMLGDNPEQGKTLLGV